MFNNFKSIFILFALAVLLITSCKKSEEPVLDPITGFKMFNFQGEADLANAVFKITADITPNTFIIQNTDSLSAGVDVTHLKANFQSLSTSVKVKVNDVDQVSGVTENNFTDPVVYETYAENGNLKKYTVKINVTKVNIPTEKYVFFNQSTGTFSEADVQKMVELFGQQKNKRMAVGMGAYFLALNNSNATNISKINEQLNLSLKYNIPILLKFDMELFWDKRSDLWNWWDQTKPGFSESNKDNVEWTGWNRESATKISWLNWGVQIRLAPVPNFMSPKYIAACHDALTVCATTIKTWYDKLPAEKKYLLGGVIVGWESSIGVASHYFPDGNSFVDQPEANDPTKGFNINQLPSRGLVTLGYAGVVTSGIATSGVLTEAMQAEVVRRHLLNVSKDIYDAGITRDRIFTHCGGWVNGESLYKAAVNKYSCPGWSFYTYAGDPLGDVTAMNALALSDAPYFGAVEWFIFGNKPVETWTSAITKTLANKGRLLSIYNWSSLVNGNQILNQNAITAIQNLNK